MKMQLSRVESKEVERVVFVGCVFLHKVVMVPPCFEVS